MIIQQHVFWAVVNTSQLLDRKGYRCGLVEMLKTTHNISETDRDPQGLTYKEAQFREQSRPDYKGFSKPGTPPDPCTSSDLQDKYN